MKKGNAFAFSSKTGNSNQRAVGSTWVIVKVDVDFSRGVIAVRTSWALREIDFTRHRVICFHDGGGSNIL